MIVVPRGSNPTLMRAARAVAMTFIALFIALGCGRVAFERVVDGGASDGGAPDSGLDARIEPGLDAGLDAGPDAGPGSIVVDLLQAEWTTAHTIRWRWEMSGSEADFERMELVVATSAADVTSRTGSARVIDASENPELGVFTLPFTGGADPSVVTISFEHTASTRYFAQLVAYDAGGRASPTPIAEGTTTAEPTREVVIFSEAATAGYSIPTELTRTSANPFQGSFAYDYVRVCDPPAAACYENLRRQGIAVDASAVDAARFDEAYLEWAVRVDSDNLHSYYSAVRVMLGAAGASQLFQFEHITIRAGRTYRVYEFPLRRLGSTPMTAADLAGRPLFEFGFGGSWPSGAVVSFDEVRIRY